VVQSGTGGTHSARCLGTRQLWIPGKHGFSRSGLEGFICLPQDHRYTYQTSVTEGTTHLPQNFEGRGSGFCIGDMVCSHGHTINPTMITQEAGQSSIDFPLQVPTGPDHTLRLKMIHSLTQAGHRLMRPLGRYIGASHRPDVWFLSKTLSSLFFKVDSGGHDVYTLNQTPHLTRYGITYTYSHHNSGPCSEAQCVIVTNWLGHTIKLHSLSLSWSGCHNTITDQIDCWQP
jgi:hypothetical protein